MTSTNPRGDAVYAQTLQNLERTRAAVRSSISKASTISDEEHQLALTEDDFLTIQWKMDRIDQKPADPYRNWRAEYKVLMDNFCQAYYWHWKKQLVVPL